MNAMHHPEAMSGGNHTPAAGAHAALAPLQDEKHLLAALIQVLRRKRCAMRGGDPALAPACLEPIWPPLLEALGRHTQRRAAAHQAETDAELRALADTLQHELDGLRHDVEAWSADLQRAIAQQRNPLPGAYASASAASHSLGRG